MTNHPGHRERRRQQKRFDAMKNIKKGEMKNMKSHDPQQEAEDITKNSDVHIVNILLEEHRIGTIPSSEQEFENNIKIWREKMTQRNILFGQFKETEESSKQAKIRKEINTLKREIEEISVLPPEGHPEEKKWLAIEMKRLNDLQTDLEHTADYRFHEEASAFEKKAKKIKELKETIQTRLEPFNLTEAAHKAKRAEIQASKHSANIER